MNELTADGELLRITFEFENATYIVIGKQAVDWRKWRLPDTGIWGDDTRKVYKNVPGICSKGLTQ